MPKSAHPWAATLVRTIFDQPDTDAVRQRLPQVLDLIGKRFPDTSTTSWPSTRSPPSCGNKIRRRADVVGIFPNRAAIIRLVGATPPNKPKAATTWATKSSAGPPHTPQRRPRNRTRPNRRITSTRDGRL
ncbi:transposase [Actinoplanes sp. CA-054009]